MAPVSGFSQSAEYQWSKYSPSHYTQGSAQEPMVTLRRATFFGQGPTEGEA